MNTIRKIIYTVFCIGVLSSCTKDDMEVQKNNNLTWKVNNKLVQDDIRTSIGYDPRYNYIGVEKSEEEVPIWTLGELIFSDETPKQLKVSLDKPAEKEIRVSLNYNSDLYDELKNQYGGYALGEENLVRILQNEKIISVGETSVIFEIEQDFTDTKKIILPFSLKVQGDDSIRKIKGSDIFVVKTIAKSFLESLYLNLSLLESSDNIKEAYEIAADHIASDYSNYGAKLEPIVNIGNIQRGDSGLRFSVFLSSWNYRFHPYYGFTLNEKLDIIDITGGSGNAWGYFGSHIQPITDIIVNNAPYGAEKVTEMRVKLISKSNPDVWFIVEER